MRVDVMASEPHFIDHTAPVYAAIPPEERGDFIITRSRWVGSVSLDMLMERAHRRGVPDPLTELGSEDRPTLVASYGDLKQARQRGRTRLAAIEHGIGQSFVDSRHGSYAGGLGREDVSLFLVPNRHSANRWQTAYPNAAVEIVGCPKLDFLPKRQPGEGPVVAISFHWGGGFPPETRSAFDNYRGVLDELVGAYTVIGHGHPRHIELLARYYKRLRIPVVNDFEDVCRQADVYVCDTNSTLYEFASTGRPVVVLNKPGRDGYRKDVHHGLRFWSAAHVGIQVDNPKDLITAVGRALEDPPEQKAAREDALSIVYKYRTGGAQRAAAAIVSWMEALARKAA